MIFDNNLLPRKKIKGDETKTDGNFLLERGKT